MTARTLCCVLLAAATAGCGDAVEPLSNTHPSAETAAAAALDALARRDAPALRALALTEQEFREHVWRDLPAARPERNLPFSYVWGDLRQKSEAGLAATLAQHGGRQYVLRRVAFGGPTSTYAGSRVYRDTVLTVNVPGAGEQAVRVFGSMIEKDGAWKIFSFVADD